MIAVSASQEHAQIAHAMPGKPEARRVDPLLPRVVCYEWSGRLRVPFSVSGVLGSAHPRCRTYSTRRSLRQKVAGVHFGARLHHLSDGADISAYGESQRGGRQNASPPLCTAQRKLARRKSGLHIGGSLLETPTYAVKPRTSAVLLVPWRLDFPTVTGAVRFAGIKIEHDPGASLSRRAPRGKRGIEPGLKRCGLSCGLRFRSRVARVACSWSLTGMINGIDCTSNWNKRKTAFQKHSGMTADSCEIAGHEYRKRKVKQEDRGIRCS